MFQQDVFNLLFEGVSEGVIVVDEQQKIVATNTSVETMFGYDKKELLYQPLNILIPKNYHVGHGTHFKSFMQHKERRKMGQGRDLCGIHSNGSEFPVEVGLNPFIVYDKTYIMALVIDISVRKEQELKIQSLNTQLEKKITDQTITLKETVAQLKTANITLKAENEKRIKAEKKILDALKKEKELNELKTKFLSLVSHEFKTPLSGILTSATLLGKYKLAGQQEKRDKHIKTITDKIHYLNAILNDFLSIEKIEAGKVNYKFKLFKLSKVVDEVVYNANMLLKDGQRIKYPEDIDDISLVQDEKIVELALSNIVHNAIKYSSENTIIDIKIHQNNDETVFKIKDSGIGIPKKDQKNIFNRYFRAENALHTQGTGIGLNIVKNHLENLGGTIHFESEENKGSLFVITLPNKARQ